MRLLILSIVASFLLGGALLTSRALAGRADARRPGQSLQEPASGSTQTPSGSEEGDQESKPAKDYEDEMEDFVPSEKLPAASAISFPVDI